MVIQFKLAASPIELEQIHRLNHQIFVEDVHQHEPTADSRLIDRFHEDNRYFIAAHDRLLVGMISVHDGPVFSVTKRLRDSAILDKLRKPLEVRLLAIRPEYRKRSVLAGLVWQVHNYAIAGQYSDLLISGIKERLTMYQKLGFQPMGPPVPDGAANFVPMRLSIDHSTRRQQKQRELHNAHWTRRPEASAVS